MFLLICCLVFGVAQERVPNPDNMFSEMGHHPRHDLRLAENKDVPGHVDQQFSGAGGGPHAMAELDMAVTGTHRYKYFKRPIVPFLQSVPPEVMMDAGTAAAAQAAELDATEAEAAAAEAAQHGGRDGKHTVAVQTDYRDGEAQTDPYTPDYVVKAGEQPAVLSLSNLTYGASA